MEFEKGNLYHIYNQGNKRQNIFFNRENYRFFLRKIKTHIVPYVDLLAWCLMPNHFHLMVVVREEELYVNPEAAASSGGATLSRTPTRCSQDKNSGATASRTPTRCSQDETSGATASRTPTNCSTFYPAGSSKSDAPTRCSLIETLCRNPPDGPSCQIPKKISLNHSIGIMLASYTQAIHKQENINGSLFRQKTKSECLSLSNGITPSFINTETGTLMENIVPEEQYPQICFDYIHNNPVAAGLAWKATDWEFSSAKDYEGLRAGGIVAKKVAGEYLTSEEILLNKNML